MRSKKVIYNVVSNFILQVIVIIYGFIVPKIIISQYGSEVNGLISSISNFLCYIAILDSGFTAVVKSVLYKPISAKENITINSILKSSDIFFKKIGIIFIIYSLLLSLVYPIIVNCEYNYFFTFILILILSISMFAEYYFGMVYRIFLQANQKSYIISNIQIIIYILTIILTIILARLNVSILLLKLFTCFIFLLRPILQNLYVKKKYDINLSSVKDNYKIEKKWDGLAQHIASVIHSNTDITVLTFFCTLSEVSIYTIYYLVVKGVKQLIQSFASGIDSFFGDMIAKNELNNLNKKFNLFEIIYYTITTICFSCTIILIVPFIKVYTLGITDINYIRYTFGCLIVISEYIWAIRLPYSNLVLAAGNFKETTPGAWVECFSNFIISFILVFKYGLIGVAIGTIIAMFIRTCELMYHCNKNILHRPIYQSIRKIIIIVIQTLIIIFICNKLPYLNNTGYLNLIINGIMTFSVACLVTILFNILIYKNEIREISKIIKKIIEKGRKHYNA